MENMEPSNQEQKPNNERPNNLNEIAVPTKGSNEGGNGNNENGHTGGNVPPPSEPWFWTRPFWSEGKRIALSLIFDFLLLAATCTYTYYASKQWTAMNGQLGEMQASGRQTDQMLCLIRQQLEQVTRQATDTHELAVQAKNQADRMAEQLPELRRSARAAQDAAKISRDAMHISEKAYITIGSPQFDFAKHIVSLSVTNNGRIPSGPIDIVAHAFVVRINSPFEQTLYLNQAIEKGWKRQHFLSVSIGSPFNITHALQKMDQTEINAGHQNIIFVGFADYNDGFPDTPTQRSFFCVTEAFNALMTQSLPFSCDPSIYLPVAEQADGYPNNEDK